MHHTQFNNLNVTDTHDARSSITLEVSSPHTSADSHGVPPLLSYLSSTPFLRTFTLSLKSLTPSHEDEAAAQQSALPPQHSLVHSFFRSVFGAGTRRPQQVSLRQTMSMHLHKANTAGIINQASLS
jgi:hypothetical protein